MVGTTRLELATSAVTDRRVTSRVARYSVGIALVVSKLDQKSGHVHAAWGFARCRMFMRGSYEKGCRSFTTTRISTRPWGRRVWHGARGWSRRRARRVLAKPRSLSFSGSSPSLSRFPPIHSVSQNPIDMLELRCQQRQFGDSFARRTGSATIRGTTAERLSISLRKAGNRRHAICKAGAWPRDVHSLPALSCIT